MNGAASKRTRLMALIRKESRQMARDKSTLTLGLLLPVVLLVIFGFGLSLDVQLVPVAVVREDASPKTRDLYVSLSLSRYFAPVLVHSMHEAEPLLRSGSVDAIVRPDTRRRADGDTAVQVIVNGRDANKARIMQRYLEGAVALWDARRMAAAGGDAPAFVPAAAETRVWYNHAMESSYFLVPGVIVLIMTLIGAFLTALVMAREWERGTFESLFATPVRAGEILASKIVPYFGLGMAGLALCLLAAVFVFEVPVRGSIAVIVGCSAIYLLVGLGIGLLVSQAVKSQFMASQIVLLSCFLPTTMLSGFVFDLRGANLAVRIIAHMFPATWYVDLVQTLFLVGTVPEIVIRDTAILAGYAVFFLGLARFVTQKRLN